MLRVIDLRSFLFFIFAQHCNVFSFTLQSILESKPIYDLRGTAGRLLLPS